MRNIEKMTAHTVGITNVLDYSFIPKNPISYGVIIYDNAVL